MYSPLESVFESTMGREGRILTTYSSGAEFRAFFRIKNDYENQRETITIYYDVTAPVHSGTLIMIENEVFLALNKETVENDVYYKSTLIKCNGVYNENKGVIFNIPFYSDNVKASLAIGNNVITTLNGNVELLTEENSLSKQIEIDQYFNEFGRTFKVTNKYSIDGILHVIGEVEADQEPVAVYDIKIDGMPSAYVKPDSTIQLSAAPYINGSATTGATFDWTSSDNFVAIVDDTGKITTLSNGTAKITVTWIEKDISESIYITVANENVTSELTYKYIITGNTNLKCSYKRTYVFSVMDDEGNIVSDIDFQWNVISDFEVTQESNDNKITLSIDNEAVIERTFILQAIVDGGVRAEVTITVVE